MSAMRTKRVVQVQLVWDKIGHQQRAMRKCAQRAVLPRPVCAAVPAVRKLSVRRRVSGQALRGVQTTRAAGEVSGAALDGEMVINEIAVTAALHQAHAGAAHEADSGIVAPAGHQTARTAVAGAQTVGGEAAAGDPAVHGATAGGGARPVLVGAAAVPHGVKMRGAERSASRPVVWAHVTIEAAPIGTGATVATTETGAPAAPAIDTPVEERARVKARAATARGASTLSWTSAARATRAMTATLTSPR